MDTSARERERERQREREREHSIVWSHEVNIFYLFKKNEKVRQFIMISFLSGLTASSWRWDFRYFPFLSAYSGQSCKRQGSVCHARSCQDLVQPTSELVLICTGHGALHPVPLWGTNAQGLSPEQWELKQCADSCPDPQDLLLFSTSVYKYVGLVWGQDIISVEPPQ